MIVCLCTTQLGSCSRCKAKFWSAPSKVQQLILTCNDTCCGLSQQICDHALMMCANKQKAAVYVADAMYNASLLKMLSAGPSVLRHAALCSLAADRSHYAVEASWGSQLGSAQVRLKHCRARSCPMQIVYYVTL